MGLNGGDVMARGAKSATFCPPKVSQAKWDAIWAEEEKPEDFHKLDEPEPDDPEK